jgi:hypothetical protein
MEPSQGRQKGKAKERPKDAQLAGTKKKEKNYGRNLSHPQPLSCCMHANHEI